MRMGRMAWSMLAAAGLGSVVSVSPASAQDLAGQWLFAVDLDAGSGEAGFTFVVQDGAITGSYAGILGEQAITGTLEGDVARFGFESIDAGAVSFEGVIDGDTIEGTCVYGALGEGTFSGSKVE